MTDRLQWVEGQLWSGRYGDVYFPRERGVEQARHVFLDGNRLAERFAALAPHEHFTIGETGFGSGLNFLCAWNLFVRTAPPDARLHVLSTELHPFEADEFAEALSPWTELAPLASELCAQLVSLPPAWHRCVFADGRVTLTLLVGDARETLREADAAVDAWFLDGFSPARNPDIWSDAVIAQVARLSRPGSTCSTWSVAGDVRRRLRAAGFIVKRAPGFGTKRSMLRGEFAGGVGTDASATIAAVSIDPVIDPVIDSVIDPVIVPGTIAFDAAGTRPARAATASARHVAPWLQRPPARRDSRTAIVIGGGLAGTSAAASLAARGLRVTLVDRHAALAAEASGNAQGVLYIKPSPHGTALTALSLAGVSFALRELVRRLPADGTAWSQCGVVVLAHDSAEADRHAQLAALGWPSSFVRAVDAGAAAHLAGIALPSGGLFYPAAGWVHPPALCASLAHDPRIDLRLGWTVDTLTRDAADGWTVTNTTRDTLHADVVVVASALDTTRLPALAHLPLKPIRGQITMVPATEASTRLATVLCGESYVAPARNGRHCLGATFDVGDAATDLRAADDVANLDALRALAPALSDAIGTSAGDDTPRARPADDNRTRSSRAAVRVVTPDYLPIAGAALDADRFRERFAALARDATTRFDEPAPWLPGLFVSTGHGSRGLVTAPIAGELIAALVTGEPLPLPTNVVQALATGRFLARDLKRRQSAR